MAQILDQPRYKCALAAMQTVQAIPRAIPVLHCGPGCAEKLNSGTGTSGTFSPNIFPCTSVSEKEVIFGGVEKLRDTIANALKVIDADLYVVLTGCTSEIIGDDVEEVIHNFEHGEKPVIFANTPGFKGNNYLGHGWVLSAIFDRYLGPSVAETSKEKGLVNIFAGPPLQDPFWLGNLRELEKLVAELGLKPNTIFGHGRGIPNINRIPLAEYNVLVSPWAGLESIQLLEKKFGTPYLHYPVLPIGAAETSKFLRALGDFTRVPPSLVERVVSEHEAEYYYYIERFADTFLELRIMSKRFVTVSDAQYSLAVTKFLVNDLGMFPTTPFITDNTPEEYRELVDAEFRKLNYGIETKPEYSTDGHAIHEQIRATDFAGNPLVLGSSWEHAIAQELSGHFVNISYPHIERLIINGCVAGYAGGLKLLEDIYTVAMGKLML
ncbi:MAG: hydrogenase [Treponema sp.]|jgi:nitrogenase molybdenum-iron protein beta chain|nr:hydrogenase [Treponema sp.]